MKNKILLLAALIMVSITGFAQATAGLSGRVVDRWGKPVSGALVSVVDNPATAVATDGEGKFVIAAGSGDKISVRTSDFGAKVLQLEDNNPVVVTMDYSTQAVDMGFGIQQTLAESTGAISRTMSEDVNKRSSFNVSNSLFGNALGLSAMQNSGLPWSNDASFYIRGLQTLSSNGILILVDGFERPIGNLSPEEVESVSVLRDASAIALYGFKGANGVLSIKTKRGKYNTREIDISYDHAFNTQVRLPEFANSYTYARAMNEALANDGKEQRYNKYELDAFQSGKYPYLYPDVNWMDEVFKDNGSSNIYNLSFRGGGSKMRYFTLLNLQDNRGFINNAEQNPDYSAQMKYSRATIRTNLDIDVTPTTKVEVGLKGLLQETSRPGLNSDNMMYALYSVPSAAFPVKTYDGIWGGSETWGENKNPAALTWGRGYSKSHNRALYADIKLDQKLDFITQGLKATIRLGYDNLAAYWEGYTRGYEYASDAVKWANGVLADTTRFKGGATSNTSFSTSLDGQDRHYNIVGSIDYTKSFGNSSLYTSFIYSFDRQVYNGQHNTYSRQNFALYNHYSYLNRYIADLTLMASGSNRLAPDHKYGFSPTLSAAWVVSNEEFMRNVSFIEFLKLRASAGIINTDFIPVVGFWEQNFGGGGGYPLGGNYDWHNGTAEGRFPSSNISMEKAYKYNFGIDAAFLKGFTLSADAYYQRRSDIFISTEGQTSTVLGVTPSYANAGIVDSYGVELGLNYDKKVGDVTLFAGGKFTLAKNKIKEQLEEPRAYDYLKRTDRPLGQIFGMQAIGFFIDQEDINNSPTQQFFEVKPGDIKYKDQNGDGVINEFDEVALGYNTNVPEIYYSFDLGAEWKGFGISATFQGVTNYSTMLNTASLYIPLIGNTNISNHYYENRWTPDNPFAKYPRLTTEINDNNYRNNSIWVADASFLKLRNCEVYYKLPASLLSKLSMKTGKVYVRGVDLVCFDKIDIADPESVGVAYPMTRSVNVGFAVGF